MDFVSNPRNAKYKIDPILPIYNRSSPNPIINGTFRYFQSRVWRSIEKLPIYSFDGYGFTFKSDLIALMLTSDLVDPRFCVEGKPGIFLTTIRAVGNPDNLIDSGYEIEFCDVEFVKLPMESRPNSFLKRVPLKVVPFVSGALLKTTIQGTKFLYRISKVGDPPPIYANVVESG